MRKAMILTGSFVMASLVSMGARAEEQAITEISLSEVQALVLADGGQVKTENVFVASTGETSTLVSVTKNHAPRRLVNGARGGARGLMKRHVVEDTKGAYVAPSEPTNGAYKLMNKRTVKEAVLADGSKLTIKGGYSVTAEGTILKGEAKRVRAQGIGSARGGSTLLLNSSN